RPEVNPLDLLVVELERFPRGTRGQGQRFRQGFASHGQLALPRAALFPAITAMSSRQESTNAFAPSSWSWVARAVRSTPAEGKRASTACLSPPSARSSPPTDP